MNSAKGQCRKGGGREMKLVLLTFSANSSRGRREIVGVSAMSSFVGDGVILVIIITVMCYSYSYSYDYDYSYS